MRNLSFGARVVLALLVIAFAVVGTVGASTNIGIFDRIVAKEDSAAYAPIYAYQAGGANIFEAATAAGLVFTVGPTGDTTTAGDLTVGDDLVLTDALTVDDISVGGGYGSTGVTISNAGVIQANGGVTSDAALTANTAAIGGGFGATGCSISAAGVLQCDGALETEDQILVGTGIHTMAPGNDGLDVLGDIIVSDDAQVASDLDVNGHLEDSTGALTIDDDVTILLDATITADATGGNAEERNQFIGLPRVALVGFGAGTNGAAAGKTLDLDDDSPAGEFVATDADVVCSNDAAIYTEGAASLQIDFTATADDGDGCHDGVAYDFTDDESMGFFIYVDGDTLAAGDLQVELTDDGGVRAIDVPIVATADYWTWIDLTAGITALANADKDVITDVSFELSAAGETKAAATPFTVYIDAVYKWDSTEEDAIGIAVLRDGVISIVNAEAGTALVEYTGYFVHEEAGVDFVVWITDQSAADLIGLVAY